jgi:hypothetical protein
MINELLPPILRKLLLRLGFGGNRFAHGLSSWEAASKKACVMTLYESPTSWSRLREKFGMVNSPSNEMVFCSKRPSTLGRY